MWRSSSQLTFKYHKDMDLYPTKDRKLPDTTVAVVSAKSNKSKIKGINTYRVVHLLANPKIDKY